MVSLPTIQGVSPASPARSPALPSLGNGGCAGGKLTASISGTLSLLGNSTPIPARDGVNLTIGYDYQVGVTRVGGQTSYSCSHAAFVVATGAAGAFSGKISLPAGGCVRGSCTAYSGPFAPGTIKLTDPAPTGYFLNGTLNGSSTDLRLVAALQSVTIAPPGPLTISVNAPTPLGARGWAANGAPSPALLYYEWGVGGIGWSMANRTSAVGVVSAVAGVGPSVVGLTVNATFDGRPIEPRSTSLQITAIPTTVTVASVQPTQLDVGAPATFSVLGSGAEGYSYRATVDPGFNGTPVSMPCPSVPAPGGSVQLACSIPVTYHEVGAAQPVVNLTNGFSTASWAFPVVTVSPALGLAAEPDRILGYSGSPVEVELARAGGTGTGPFGPACLSTGDGQLACVDGSGPTWTFDPTYGRPGSYTAVGTVVDAAGLNASVRIPAVIADRPALGDLLTSTQTAPQGAPIELSSWLSGGLGPVTLWWNDSLPRSTFSATTVTGPGPVTATYSSNVPGAHVVTLAIEDSLGTRVAVESAVFIEPPPTTLDWLGGPPSSLTAGVPFAVSWIALSANGTRTPQFAEPVTLSVATPASAPMGLSIEAAVPGALDEVTNRTFVLNETDWYAGYLNFSLTIARAGSYSIAIGSELPAAFAPTGSYALNVGPQVEELRLVGGQTRVNDGRTNHTLWDLVDPYGNPAPAGRLFVIESFDGATTHLTTPILVNATAAGVWLNYTAPGGASGSIEVISEWNQTLALFLVAAPPGALPPLALVGIASAATVAVAYVGLQFARRRRRPAAPRDPSSELGPDELKRYAEGRTAMRERLRAEGPLTMAQILDPEGPVESVRSERADWLASLITEGEVVAERVPDGEPVFRAVDGPVAPRLPRVDLDPSALDRQRAVRGTGNEPEEYEEGSGEA